MTLTFENPTLLVLIFVITFAGGLTGLTWKNRVAGLRGRDQLRALSYLTRYSAALEYYGIPRRELRARVDELRVDLGDPARGAGVESALAGLGSPRALAAEVAGNRLSPSWLRGTLWLGAALLAGLVAQLWAMSAFLSGFESVARPGETATWHGPLWSTLEATAGADGQASQLTVELSFAPMPLLLVAFLVGARAWRIWTGRSTRAATA